jgi:hypothetical protein
LAPSVQWNRSNSVSTARSLLVARWRFLAVDGNPQSRGDCLELANVELVDRSSNRGTGYMMFAAIVYAGTRSALKALRSARCKSGTPQPYRRSIASFCVPSGVKTATHGGYSSRLAWV